MSQSIPLDPHQIKNYQVHYIHPLQESHHSNFIRSQYPHQNIQRQKIILDTPSTSKGITRSNQKINSIAQHNHNQQNQKFNYRNSDLGQRIDGKILSLQEIKDNEVWIKERALSRGSINSQGTRKIFVSIAKSNRNLSENRGSLMSQQNLISPAKISNEINKKIKLTKYLELKGNHKSNQK